MRVNIYQKKHYSFCIKMSRAAESRANQYKRPNCRTLYKVCLNSSANYRNVEGMETDTAELSH